jgi:putative ABC transport system permease protein
MRELLARLNDWLRRDRLDAELAEELRFHKEHLERDSRASGVDADDAHWAARRQFGNATRVIEDARDRWSLPWFDHLQQDLRYAIRGLRRSPDFAITVILTLGLGIGANAAMFGVIDRLMFRPYPYLRDPASVDRVYLEIGSWNAGTELTVFPYTRYLDLQRWTRSFSQHAAFLTATHGVGMGEATRQRGVQAVSANFFEFFDAHPVLGRFFLASEDAIPLGANVAVVSFDYWKTELGARDVIGNAIQVGNGRYTIVGVAPPGFVGVSEEGAPSIFVPITAYAANEGGGNKTDYFLKYNWDWIEMMSRRKPGVSRAAASADLTNAFLLSWNASRLVHPLYGSAEKMHPRALAGPLKTAAGPAPGLEAKTLVWVTGVAGIVLLIACANVANLLLARAMRRRREVALRLALGVSRGRLATQAFTETLLLSLLGCVAGIAFAQWGGLAIRRLFIFDTSAFDVVADWRTLAVSMAAALAAAIVTGIAPVFFAGHPDITRTLKSGARAGTYQRSSTRAALLVMQAALSVVLLVGAGLFVRSLENVRHLPLGYDLDPVLLVQWYRRGVQLDSADNAALRRRLLETALARGDVEHGAWVNNAVFGRGTSIINLAVPGVDSVSRLGRFTFQIVSDGYFATMNTRVLRGRSFAAEDRAGTVPVVVVSAAMAEKLWPRQDPLGRCVKLSWQGIRPDTMPCTTVVGVVENAVHDPVVDFPLRYYLPEAQVDFGASWLLLRMRRDPAVAAEDVRRALQSLLPGQSIVIVRPARELLDAKRRSWVVGATMFVGLGMLALIVAAVGLYGVISYNVAERTHELGVRIALGAQSLDVVRLVLGQGTRFATLGLAIGGTLSLLAARWIQPLLFQQSARDPVVLVVVGLLLLFVTLLASGIPALRATRADPNTVLRSE